MSTQQSTQAFFEAASGVRYAIPEGKPSPIVIGRIAQPGAESEGIGIPQSEQTKFVSRRHAELWQTDSGAWEIADAGSASGLWVGAAKAEPEKRYPLAEGTRIKLGNYELTFHTGEGAAAADGGTMVLRDFNPAEAEAPSPEVPTGPRWFLDSFAEGQTVEIDFPATAGITHWTVGRAMKAEGNDPALAHVTIPNRPEFTTVSRRHIELARAAEGMTVRNLSSQGSTLNGQPLGDEPVAIKPGDKIIMGNRVFILREGVIKPHYNESDFVVPGPATMAAGFSADDPDLIDTRELPLRSVSLHAGEGEDELPAWGELIENKLMSPRSFPLRKRKTKIGSHPINCDIKLDDPGIEDLHATIEWHGRECKVHSKAHDAPVRVNHSAYRVSPPIKSGAVVTLGNQEFHINITGQPPEATGTLVAQRVNRLLILAVITIVFVCGATLMGARMLTPKPRSYALDPAPEAPDKVIASVLQSRGLAGIPVLAEMGNDNKLSPEQTQILKKLQDIAALQEMIDKTPERDFRTDVEKIEAQLKDGGQVFQMAGLSASQADQGWYKGLVDRFEARRRAVYSNEWNVLLTALRNNDLPNAARMLASMHNTSQDLLDQAQTAIDRWTRISDAMREQSQDQLLDGYVTSVKNQRGHAFLVSQRQTLGQLVSMLDEIEKDPSETSDSLMKSNQWPTYKAKLVMLNNTLLALEAHEKGDLGDFNKAYAQLDKAAQTPLLRSMQQNLQAWSKWQDDFKAAGNPSAHPELIGQLSALRIQFSQSLDPNSPLLREIASRISSLSSSRNSQAETLRQQAAQLPEGFERINKLLDAFRYDSNFQAESEIDSLTAKMCGIILKNGTIAQERDNLTKVRDRINGYIRDGIMSRDNMASVRQIDTLLSQK